MPIYFFGMNDQPADQATGEDMPNDGAAREWAARVTVEINRNRRHPGFMVRVKRISFGRFFGRIKVAQDVAGAVAEALNEPEIKKAARRGLSF
jgi:hypothetical protein